MIATTLFVVWASLAASQTGASPPPAPAPDLPLEETAWMLTHFGKEPVTAPKTTRAASLQFHGAELRVSGSTGCNRLSGQYKKKGHQLSFLPLATTRMLCPDAVDLESKFLATISKVARYKIVGKQLNLYDAKGVLLARFAA